MYQSTIPVWMSIVMDQPATQYRSEVTELRLPQTQSGACLVMIALGSRDPRWREPFERLYATVRRTTSRPLKLAYMKLISPTLIECAEQAAREGATQLDIMPVFMAADAHVAADIGEQAQKVRECFPQMRVNILPPIGEDRRMFSLMCEILREKIA